MEEDNQSGQEELALPQALNALLLDEELSDVTITSPLDDTRLSANRCILASRSAVFRQMLFGNFAEASNDTIVIQYTGSVLRMILEYCYTDRIESLSDTVQTTIERSLSKAETVSNVNSNPRVNRSKLIQWEHEEKEFCRTLSNLGMAADFLHLPRLGKMAADALKEILNKIPRLSCITFDETVVCVENVVEGLNNAGHEVCQYALEVIRKKPVQSLWGHSASTKEESAPTAALVDDISDQKAIVKPGVLDLGTTALQKVLQDKYVKTTEINLFCALLTWVKSCQSPSDATNDESRIVTNEEKMDFAKELTQYMRLDRIKPSDLCELVSPSGLVDLNQLSEAYRSQALLAERRGVHHPMCRVPVWDNGCHGIYFDQRSPSSSPTSSNVAPPITLSTTAKAPFPHTLHNVYLQWDEMMPGTIHKWDICVNAINSSSDAVWVGVVNTSLPYREGNSSMLSPSSDFLGNSKCGYLYGSAVGESVHGGRRVKGLPHFSQKVVISFTLDLRIESPKNGTLVAQANGFNPVILFENMLKQNHAVSQRRLFPEVTASFVATPSYLPAAVLLNGAEIEFLGFQSPDTIDTVNSFD